MKKTAEKKGVMAKTAGFKMKKQRAVGPKKSEPDDPILGKQNQKLGGAKAQNQGAMANSKAARMKRLNGRLI